MTKLLSQIWEGYVIKSKCIGPLLAVLAAAFSQDTVATASMYTHKLSPAKIAEISKSLERVKVGDSLVIAKSILGKPSSETTLYRPRLDGSQEHSFTIVTYEIRRVSATKTSPDDERISLFFDKRGKLYSVVSPFCESRPSQDAPSRHCE